MLQRKATFLKDIQCLCYYWGIDAGEEKASSAINDFAERIEKIFNDQNKEFIEKVKKMPDADNKKDNGKVIDSVADSDTSTYFLVFENGTKLGVPLENFISNNADEHELSEEEIEKTFQRIINTLKNL